MLQCLYWFFRANTHHFFLSIWWIFHLLCRFIGLKKRQKSDERGGGKSVLRMQNHGAARWEVPSLQKHWKNVKSRIIFWFPSFKNMIFWTLIAVIVVTSCVKYNAYFLTLKTHLGCMVSHKADVRRRIGKYTENQPSQKKKSQPVVNIFYSMLICWNSLF